MAGGKVSSSNSMSHLRPNRRLNQLCNSARRPGLISSWPARRPLPPPVGFRSGVIQAPTFAMPSLLLSAAAAAALFAFFAIALWLGNRRWMSLGEGREHEERVLRSLRNDKASAEAGEPQIWGSSAQIPAEDQTGTFQAGRALSYSFTLLAKTPADPYFMYVANDEDKPYVELLTAEAASRMRKSMKLVSNTA